MDRKTWLCTLYIHVFVHDCISMCLSLCTVVFEPASESLRIGTQFYFGEFSDLFRWQVDFGTYSRFLNLFWNRCRRRNYSKKRVFLIHRRFTWSVIKEIVLYSIKYVRLCPFPVTCLLNRRVEVDVINFLSWISNIIRTSNSIRLLRYQNFFFETFLFVYRGY